MQNDDRTSPAHDREAGGPGEQAEHKHGVGVYADAVGTDVEIPQAASTDTGMHAAHAGHGHGNASPTAALTSAAR